MNLFLAGFSHLESLCIGVGEKASKTVEETTSTSGTSGARYFFNSAGMLTVATSVKFRSKIIAVSLFYITTYKCLEKLKLSKLVLYRLFVDICAALNKTFAL